MRRRGAGRFGWFRVLVEEFFQLLKIFLQGGKQIALVQGGSRMEQRKEHKVLHVKGLRLYFGNADLPL